MKYIVIVGDGMGDYPLKELGGKTPLQAANKPNIDSLAANGSSGMLQTIPKGYTPGSDVANLSILGYDPAVYHPGGRGPIEAAAQGVSLKPRDLAFRANIITVKEGIIKDYSARKINNEDAKALIAECNKHFGKKDVEFYPGISYRNLLILRNADLEPGDFSFNAPHDHTGEPFKGLMAKGKGKAKVWAERINEWTLKSQEIFATHPLGRRLNTQNPGLSYSLWVWGPGKKKCELPTLKERFGWKGVVISGVDLIKGLGALAGLKIIEVPGATAYFDTNFEGKSDYAMDALDSGDNLAFIHIEAPDEAGHEGMVDEKVRAIENIDKRVVGRILKRIKGNESQYRIGFLCDHATPIRLKTHSMDPIPFVISGGKRDGVAKYDEESSKKGAYGLRKGHEFIELLAASK